MKIQKNPVIFYLKRVVLLFSIAVGLSILENVIYQYFLQISVVGGVIKCVKPVMTVVKFFMHNRSFLFWKQDHFCIETSWRI